MKLSATEPQDSDSAQSGGSGLARHDNKAGCVHGGGPDVSARMLGRSPLFKGLTEPQLSQLSALALRTTVAHGEYVFHVGDRSDKLYIIVHGEVEITKESTGENGHHRLMTLGPGDSFGEGALLPGKVREVAVRALGDCELLSLRADDLNAAPARHETLAAGVRLNLGEQVANNLRLLGDTTTRSMQVQLAEANARAATELFVITTFVTICAYVFLLEVALRLVHGKVATFALTVPGFLFFILLFLRAVQRSGQPLANYGFTTRSWKKAVVEAGLASLPIMALTVFAKWMLINFVPGMENEQLFAFMRQDGSGYAMRWLEVAAYVGLSPFQEFVVRGGIQGAFENFLTGRHRVLKAIFSANVVYSMLHLYMSVSFSILVFIPGLVWGWLYSRHRTLVGISLSHALCGIFCFFVVGFDSLIQTYG